MRWVMWSGTIPGDAVGTDALHSTVAGIYRTAGSPRLSRVQRSVSRHLADRRVDGDSGNAIMQRSVT